MTATTSRTIVRKGIAQYLGGSFVENVRAYQNGPLTEAGLGTVRAGWGKRMNMNDFFTGMPPGRGMGAYVIVHMPDDHEFRAANAGAPVLDVNDDIIAGGIKRVIYRVTLMGFHLAEVSYAEDAQEDLDDLIEAIKQQMRIDRTLGGCCMDAGQTSYGIKSHMDVPGFDDENNRVGTEFNLMFDVRAEFIG